MNFEPMPGTRRPRIASDGVFRLEDFRFLQEDEPGFSTQMAKHFDLTQFELRQRLEGHHFRVVDPVRCGIRLAETG